MVQKSSDVWHEWYRNVVTFLPVRVAAAAGAAGTETFRTSHAAALSRPPANNPAHGNGEARGGGEGRDQELPTPPKKKQKSEHEL